MVGVDDDHLSPVSRPVIDFKPAHLTQSVAMGSPNDVHRPSPLPSCFRLSQWFCFAKTTAHLIRSREKNTVNQSNYFLHNHQLFFTLPTFSSSTIFTDSHHCRQQPFWWGCVLFPGMVSKAAKPRISGHLPESNVRDSYLAENMFWAALPTSQWSYWIFRYWIVQISTPQPCYSKLYCIHEKNIHTTLLNVSPRDVGGMFRWIWPKYH